MNKNNTMNEDDKQKERREYYRLKRAKSVKFRKQNNLCVDCGNPKLGRETKVRCSNCAKLSLIYQKRYQIVNREKVKIASKKYRDSHRITIQLKDKERRFNNLEKFLLREKEYRLKNKDKISSKRKESRRRKRENQ